jgi:hypothetical protein
MLTYWFAPEFALVRTRVRSGSHQSSLIRNISVENGAKGTVFAFVYSGTGPTTPHEYVPKQFALLED